MYILSNNFVCIERFMLYKYEVLILGQSHITFIKKVDLKKTLLLWIVDFKI